MFNPRVGIGLTGEVVQEPSQETKEDWHRRQELDSLSSKPSPWLVEPGTGVESSSLETSEPLVLSPEDMHRREIVQDRLSQASPWLK